LQKNLSLTHTGQNGVKKSYVCHGSSISGPGKRQVRHERA